MRFAARLLLCFAAVVALVLLSNALVEIFAMNLMEENAVASSSMMRNILFAGAAVYAVLLAVPFVPGAEIGITLLTLFGTQAAVLVYLATVVGLSIAFIIGQLVPAKTVSDWLQWFGLIRAAEMIARTADLPPEARLRAMISTADKSWMPFLLRHRYIAVALALNIPGNFLIGGGGGIAMVAGLSKLFSPLKFLVAIALGVLPIPLALMIYGQL